MILFLVFDTFYLPQQQQHPLIHPFPPPPSLDDEMGGKLEN